MSTKKPADVVPQPILLIEGNKIEDCDYLAIKRKAVELQISWIAVNHTTLKQKVKAKMIELGQVVNADDYAPTSAIEPPPQSEPAVVEAAPEPTQENPVEENSNGATPEVIAPVEENQNPEGTIETPADQTTSPMAKKKPAAKKAATKKAAAPKKTAAKKASKPAKDPKPSTTLTKDEIKTLKEIKDVAKVIALETTRGVKVWKLHDQKLSKHQIAAALDTTTGFVQNAISHFTKNKAARTKANAV